MDVTWSSSYIIDTHCHLDYLDQSIHEVKELAASLGVRRFMTIAVEEKQWQNLLEIGTDDKIDVALGIHPCDVINA